MLSAPCTSVASAGVMSSIDPQTQTTRPKTMEAAADDAVIVCDNLIGGEFSPPVSGTYLDVISPSDGTVLGRFVL